MRRHFLAIAVILTAASGCDNVAWGGIEVSVRSPSAPSAADSIPPADSLASPTPIPLRLGTLLLAGARDGSEARLAPVALLIDGVLEPLPEASDSAAHAAVAAMLGEGSEWTLFAAGAPVGTARSNGTARDPELCGFDLVVRASLSLDPGATTAQRFLALSPAAAATVPPAAYAPLAHTYDQRVASLALGRDAIPRVGATWPPDGMLPVRRDIQAFRPVGSQAPSIAASFVLQDGLDTTPPGTGAWAMFLLADPSPDGFRQTYLWYRPAAEGKAAPMLMDHLDWDADGSPELLLEVFGANQRGWITLERTPDGSWTEAFRGSCPHTAAGTER